MPINALQFRRTRANATHFTSTCFAVGDGILVEYQSLRSPSSSCELHECGLFEGDLWWPLFVKYLLIVFHWQGFLFTSGSYLSASVQLTFFWSIIFCCTTGNQSLWYIGINSGGRRPADTAAVSTFSFPGIPTWLGIQQNVMDFPPVTRWWIWYCIDLTTGCTEYWLSRDRRELTESEKITNSLSFLNLIISTAMCNAWSSAGSMSAAMGSDHLRVMFGHIAAAPASVFDPSVYNWRVLLHLRWTKSASNWR